MPEPLQLLTDADNIHEAFSNWCDALMELGAWRDGLRWLSEGKIFVRVNRTETIPGQSVALGLDPTGHNATVELNEPLQYGTENPLSGVARDQTGRLYLLRQGRLQKNIQSARIDESLFVERTGLKPANVTIHGAPAKRSWFIVTALDVPSADICRNTAVFVDRCNLARDADAAAIAKQDDDRLAELFGKPEQGGQSAGQPTINLNQHRRIQGEVWQKLEALLVADGRGLVKPRHARGYEVDGEIETETEKLLLEIKTDSTAADIYMGIGQLILYPKLLPRLSGHRRILLLPRLPSSPLVESIRECGVELHCYDLRLDGEEVRVRFSDQFLQLCDLGS